MDKPLNTSILSTDWYEFPTMFYEYYFHLGVNWVSGAYNRTKAVRTADIIPEEAIREQLAAVQALRFDEKQIAFLRGTGTFAADPLGFEQYLRDFQFARMDVYAKDGQWMVDTCDLFAETFVTVTINGLLNHYREKQIGISREKVFAEAERTLRAKIPTLRKLPKGSVLEFGTRRAYSPEWQRRELEILLNEVPEIVTATSNVQLALDFGIPWAGTHPHAGVLLEILMALIKIFEHGNFTLEEKIAILRAAHMQFFKNWWKIFPYASRVALTDTFGDDAFWTDWSYDLAYEGRGYRWDSDPWKKWTDRTVAENLKLGIPLTDRYSGKDAVYSDGLDPEAMYAISEYTHTLPTQDAAKRMFRQVLFGWGTDGSNDTGGLKALGFTPISLVFKPKYGFYQGQKLWLVKISNNPAKMTEAPAEFQQLMLQAFGYEMSEHQFVRPVV